MALYLYEQMTYTYQPSYRLLQALLASFHDDQALILFSPPLCHKAIADGILTCWSARRPELLDFHRLSRPAAKAALWMVLSDLLYATTATAGTTANHGRAIHPIEKDLVIITGQGRRNEIGVPVIKPSLKSFLANINGPMAIDVPENRGRLVVPTSELQRWVQEQRQNEPLFTPTAPPPPPPDPTTFTRTRPKRWLTVRTKRRWQRPESPRVSQPLIEGEEEWWKLPEEKIQ